MQTELIPTRPEVQAAMAMQAPTIETILARAVESGKSPDELGRLLDVYERMQAIKREAAFNEAFAAFQRERPRVVSRHENTQFQVTRLGTRRPSRYADKLDIMEPCGPVLSRHGLSVEWGSPTMTSDGNYLSVPCIVRHVDGFSKTTAYPFPVAPDSRNTSPNPQQRWASVMSYAERYSLKAALGITEAEEDDDDGNQSGTGEPAKRITEDQARSLQDFIVEVGADLARLKAYFKVQALDELTQGQLENANRMLEERRKANAKGKT